MKRLLLFFPLALLLLNTVAQQPGTSINNVLPPVNNYGQAWQQVLEQNKFLNTAGKPSEAPVKLKKRTSQDVFFYILLGLVFLLAFIRVFFSRYFGSLFRVFFNTSLKQNQLKDQLIQAKLPSLFCNVFFVISAGTYIFFLLRYYGTQPLVGTWVFWFFSILAIAAIYIAKYATLKFTGWVTGINDITDTYVFITFLVNKILGIFLLPLTIVMVFAGTAIAPVTIVISLVFIGIMLLLRFFRSYGLLQTKLKVNPFHFFLYLAGAEIIPLLLIYKGLMILLQKNL